MQILKNLKKNLPLRFCMMLNVLLRYFKILKKIITYIKIKYILKMCEVRLLVKSDCWSSVSEMQFCEQGFTVPYGFYNFILSVVCFSIL